MFIKKIEIENFRLFQYKEITNFNIPDGQNSGSGLNVFVGKNGNGKTTVLDAISYCILEYKQDIFNIKDFNNVNKNIFIKIFLNQEFKVAGTMPNSHFLANGFQFKGNFRQKDSKNYLVKPLACDQTYISVDKAKPKPNSPDLRLAVNNPFSGKRFNELDLIYLDKSRIFQIKSGKNNATRFDRIMNDFNFQYNKNSDNINDINLTIKTIVAKDKVKNEYLSNATQKFKEISNIDIKLDLIDNYMPYENAKFVIKKDNNLQLDLSSIGSGYEMIFSLLYNYYMSKQSGKNMILLIDEPELHLHPVIQEKFIKFLLEISKDSQVFITTHSNLLIKQLAYNNFISTLIFTDNNKINQIDDRKLSYISSNETNFLAFELATEEYHNELYESLKEKYENVNNCNVSIKDFDNDFFVNQKGERKNSPWKKNPNSASIHTFIRNQIHHRSENGEPKYDDLNDSIKFMRSCF